MGSAIGRYHPRVSRTASQAAVIELLRHGRPGRMLDIPSGGGPVVDEAQRLGYEVIELDLFPRADMRGVQADACASLPFHDGAFDVVVSMEGIEHFENQTGFLRECARVLRPGGRLVITTPNVMHLSTRVAVFLTGQRVLKQGFVNEVSTLRSREGSRLYHGHAYLIDVFRLRYILRVIGLKRAQLRFCELSPSSALMAPALPAIWIATRWSLFTGRRRLQKAKRQFPPPEVESELTQLAISPALLFGKKLVLVAEKPLGAREPISVPAV